MSGCLVQVSPLDPATGTRVTLRAGTSLNSRTLQADNVQWHSAVASPPKISLDFFDLDYRGTVQFAKASLVLNSKHFRGYDKDYLTTLIWQDAPIIIWSGDGPATVDMAQEFTGIVTAGVIDRTSWLLPLQCEVDKKSMDVPLLNLEFGGGGGSDGDPEVRGQLRPACFGRPINVPVFFFDQTKWIGQVDGYGNCTAIDVLYEDAASFGPKAANYANYAALAAAAVAEGTWATCVAEGLIRLGADPQGVITTDPVCGYATPGTMMQRWLTAHAGVSAPNINTQSFTDLDAALTALLGHAPAVSYYTQSQVQVLERIQAMCASVNATCFRGPDGKITVSRAISNAAAALTLQRIGGRNPAVLNWKSMDTPEPWWRLKATAARTWRVHSLSEVDYVDDLKDMGNYSAAETYRQGMIVYWSGDGRRYLWTNPVAGSGHAPPDAAYWAVYQAAVDATVVKYADGVPVEARKPSEAGADVTGSHTASAILGQGSLATRNDVLWGTHVTGRPANLSALLGTEKIDNALLKAAITDDNVLQIPEKIGPLATRNAILEATYASASARAAEVGVTLTALNVARTNWLNLLDSYDSGRLVDHIQAWDFINGEAWVGGGSVTPFAGIPGFSHTRTGTEILIDTDGSVLSFAPDVIPITQQGLILNTSLTNLLLNAGGAANLATQIVAVTAQSYVLAFVGTGSVTLSGAAAGVVNGASATQQTIYTFTPAAGNLTLTVAGTVQYAVLYASAGLAAPVPIVATAGAPVALGTPTLKSTSLLPDGVTVPPAQDWMLEFAGDLTNVAQTASLIALGNTANAVAYLTLVFNSALQWRLSGVANANLGSAAGAAVAAGKVGAVIRRVGGHYSLTVRQAAGESLLGPSAASDAPADGYNQIFFGGYSGGGRPQGNPIKFAGFRLGTFTAQDASDRALALYNETYALNRQAAWNDFQSETTIYTPAFGDENFPAAWTIDNLTATNKRLPYWNLSDQTRAVAGRVYRDFVVGGEQKMTFAVPVKKGSGQAGGNPSLQLKTLGGAAQKDCRVQLDRNTGAVASTGTALDDFGALDLGDDWLLWGTVSGYVDSTGVRAEFYPLWSQNLAHASDVTLRGGVDVNTTPLFAKGDWRALGAQMLTARFRDYSNVLEATTRAISQKDYGADINGLSLFDSASGTPSVPLTRSQTLTSLGTASAITGQGALATKSSVAYGTDDVSGFGALAGRSNVLLGSHVRNAGDTITLGDVDLITASGTASAIVGQGALATKSAVTWASADVSGTPTELTDGRVAAGLTSGGDLNRNISAARQISSNILSRTGGGTFTGELAADVTSTHTASAVTGQGAWATYSTISPTTMANRTQSLNTSGRLIDFTALKANRSYGLRSVFDAPTFSDTYVGAGNITINIGASTLTTDTGATISLPSGTITGRAETTKYFLYRTMTDPSSATGSYGAATSLAGAIDPDRIYLGYWTTRTGSGGTGGGGTYGTPDCVVLSAFVDCPLRGRIPSEGIGEGDAIRALNETNDGTEYVTVLSATTSENECVRLTTASGAQLTEAVNTQIDQPDGSSIRACHALGGKVSVEDEKGLRWEIVTVVEPIGSRPVRHIFAGGRTFGAGDNPDVLIYTHNAFPLK